MDIIRFYLAKLLYFLQLTYLPSAIILMLPQADKQLIEEKIKLLDAQTNNKDFALTGYKKRKIVVRYFIDQLLKRLDYFWLNAIFDALPEDSKEYLANAIVEVIFFNLKKLENGLPN